jgi:hypothetical protein
MPLQIPKTLTLTRETLRDLARAGAPMQFATSGFSCLLCPPPPTVERK